MSSLRAGVFRGRGGDFLRHPLPWITKSCIASCESPTIACRRSSIACVSALRPRDGGFHRLHPRLGNAGEQDLGQAVHECEQGLLGPPEPEHLRPDLLDTGGKSFFGSDQFFTAPR